MSNRFGHQRDGCKWKYAHMAEAQRLHRMCREVGTGKVTKGI